MEKVYSKSSFNNGITVCLNTLKTLNYEIKNIDSKNGIINAHISENILSYGNDVIISIKNLNDTIEINIQSNSVGIQVIDWGVNKLYEKKIVELITKKLL